MASVFESLKEIYQDGVAESDKLGYAEKYKRGTELFFDGINGGKDDVPFHFEDVEYLDGYFVFGRGTNSVVHFHVKECPGWLFGIWWKPPKENTADAKYIDGEFFTQFEETIDKFKPSRSEIHAEFTAYPYAEREWCVCDYIKDILSFIKNEPHLAFCRDYYSWDYNVEFHSREEAKERYEKFRVREESKVKYTKIFNERILNFVRTKILPCFNDAEIYDQGENISPRYDVRASYQKNQHLVDEPGLYALFEDDDEKGKALMDELKQIEKECYDFADENEFSWWSPISHCIFFYETCILGLT